ncbi:MAG: LD-carboxypeptidase [Desulfobacterales bacterium]|nr:LD-carboxypeptidase [Desulfobacterales bacterium]MDX2512757.1 LD-carboxypeptidase [Desulfobacterales bacterium]
MEAKIIKPARLSPGDVIGIVAPAGPFEIELFERGVAAIKKMGFEVLIPENLQNPVRYLAGTDAHRASLLSDLFNSPDINGIICARGGYGSIRILDRIDYDQLRQHPKIFLGFSDISALLSAIAARGDLVVFHGPNITTLGMATPQTKASFYRAVTSDQPLDIKSEKPRVVSPGKCTGIVSGGNLTTLCHLLGTPYSPTYRGRILVLEDTGEASYRIDRMLFQMRMAGCFQGVSGVVLGSFQDCGNYEGICEITSDFFEDIQIPILGGFEIGHGKDNLTLPMGIRATLDTDQGALVYHEAALV